MSEPRPPDETAVVDPRAPRFGQAITASGLLLGIGFDLPELVYAVAVILVVAVLSSWRIDVYALLWRHVISRAIDPPGHMEAAAPHRFAKVMGASGTLMASGFLLVGYSIVGYGIAGAVALLAGLAATTGICLGCRMYRQVSFLSRLDIV